MNITSKLPTWHLEDKLVFLRADLNVPMIGQTIISDFRLRSLQPTLNFILEHEGSIILVTHIGRPKKPNPDLSTKVLLPWFEKHGYHVVFAENIEKAQHIKLKPRQILLLENIRFFSGEKGRDPSFAQKLAQLAEYYVNDAFGVAHRHDTSVTLVAEQFRPEKRTIGFLIERELTMFNQLMKNPEQPFLTISGGGKITDKIPLLQGMLAKTQTVLLCPAIVFTFAKAVNKQIGRSLVDDGLLDHCKKIIEYAQKHTIRLLFPVDYQIADKAIEGPLSIVDAENFPTDSVGISIGPKTVKLFLQEIQTAHTIFFNAAMGFAHRPETRHSTNELLQAIAHASGTSIIAGGDSVAAAQQLGIENNIDHLSTGGGAALAYLSGQKLPALEFFD